MGFTIRNTPSASAPDFEDGLVSASFAGLAKIAHPEWAGEGRYGYDNGDRLHWTFTLTDEDGNALYNDGDPILVEAVNSTNFNTKSDKSKNAQWMKNISPAAFAAIDAGTGFDVDDLIGAACMLLLERKDNGWPKVVNVLPAKKRAGARRTAASLDD